MSSPAIQQGNPQSSVAVICLQGNSKLDHVRLVSTTIQQSAQGLVSFERSQKLATAATDEQLLLHNFTANPFLDRQDTLLDIHSNSHLHSLAGRRTKSVASVDILT